MVRVVPGERAVHLGIIERVAARQDHVTEALAVGASQFRRGSGTS